jgi:hypothetical protein
MTTLEFECPKTGQVVTTGIELAEASYKGISYSTTFIHCPHCSAPHRLSHVRSWLGDGDTRPAYSKSHQGEAMVDNDDLRELTEINASGD